MGTPQWNDYFLFLAFVASTKSKDAETHHGCVIVQHRHVIGTGYNGFPKGFPDHELPDKRPDKYPWMIHSEVNAVLNCSTKPRKAVAYVTGRPCYECTKFMYQAGIRKVVVADRLGWKDQGKREQEDALLVKFLEKAKKKGFSIITVKPNFDFCMPLVREMLDLGFINGE